MRFRQLHRAAVTTDTLTVPVAGRQKSEPADEQTFWGAPGSLLVQCQHGSDPCIRHGVIKSVGVAGAPFATHGETSRFLGRAHRA